MHTRREKEAEAVAALLVESCHGIRRPSCWQSLLALPSHLECYGAQALLPGPATCVPPSLGGAPPFPYN